jgi:hypothetical protein
LSFLSDLGALGLPHANGFNSDLSHRNIGRTAHKKTFEGTQRIAGGQKHRTLPHFPNGPTHEAEEGRW